MNLEPWEYNAGDEKWEEKATSRMFPVVSSSGQRRRLRGPWEAFTVRAGGQGTRLKVMGSEPGQRVGSGAEGLQLVRHLMASLLDNFKACEALLGFIVLKIKAISKGNESPFVH